MPNGHFEAKLHGFRRTQDGVVISYVIHPNDVSTELATAALGTRYMVAFSEIGDDGKPVEARSSAVEQAAYNRQVVGSKPTAPTKDRKPFNTLPLSQQAALRCNDEKFCAFMAAKFDFSSYDTDVIANAVRYECHVKSRSEFDTDADAARFWKKLDAEFSAWLTDQRYGESAR